ncbi:MAG: hypothetical protein K5852_04475 [Eubacterium sp.]|nr:hypothetical protein [Eubacterium sp.]
MKKKRAVLLTGILCCALLLSGCSKLGQKVTILKKTTPTPAASEAAVTPAPTGTPDKPKEASAAGTEVNLKQMEGVYLEEGSKKGMIRLLAKSDKIMRIYVDYPDKAYGEPHWEMTGIYDSSKKEIVYTDATMTRKIYKDGKETTETVYTLGSGSFSVSGPKLTWNDDKSQNTGIQAVIGNQSSFVYEMSLDTYQQKQAASSPIKSGNNFTVTPDKPEALNAAAVTPPPQALNANAVTPVPTPTPVVTQTPIVTAPPAPAVTQTPVVTAPPAPEVTQTPVVTAPPAPEVTQTPVVTAPPAPEVTQTPVVTAPPAPEVTQAPAVTAEPTPEVTQAPAVTDAPTETVTYTIVWMDRNGNLLDTQYYTANEPEPETGVIPENSEDDEYIYVFTGWDGGNWDETGTVKTYTAQYDPQPKSAPEAARAMAESPETETAETPEEQPYEEAGESEDADPYEETDGSPEGESNEEAGGDPAEAAGYETGGWIPAADASEAAAMTGMYFDEIGWDAIPEGFYSVDYQYQDGAICANYRDGEGTAGLLIGKTQAGSGVSDDLFSGGRYADREMWSVQAGSVTVSCKGSGGLINEAAFETEEARYVIVFEEGEEQSGLSEEEICSLVYAITGESPAEAPEEGAAGMEGANAESPEAGYEEVPQEFAAGPEEYTEEYVEPVYENPDESWTEESAG